jgi:hypothetical protein
MPITSSDSAPPRSGFVTGLAWTFIVLAGFATFISLLQNIMISIVFPVEEMRAAMREAEKSQPMPAFFGFMFENFRLFFGLFFLVCVVTLISSIGLLRRKNWARLMFVGIMMLGVLWNFAGAVIPYFMFSSFSPIPEGAPGDFRDNFELMAKIMMGFMVVMAIAFAALFGWIVKRLLSDDIRREFLAL